MTLEQSARISLLADLIERHVRRHGDGRGFSVTLNGVSMSQIVVHVPTCYHDFGNTCPTPWGKCNNRDVAIELMARRACAVGRAEGMRNVDWLDFWNP